MNGVCMPSATPLIGSAQRDCQYSHPLERSEQRRALRLVNMPFEKGPEDRHDVASFQEKGSPYFTKFNPYASPPADKCSLAPLRDDVPIVDPCSGFVSTGADADLQPGGRNIPILGSYKSDEYGVKGRPQTPPTRPSSWQGDQAEEKRWNSRAVSDAYLRAKLGGWTSPVRVLPAPPRFPCTLTSNTFFFNVDHATKDGSSRNWREELAKKYMYTSSTQRSYEDIDWDSKLPPRKKPPASTFEKMADPVNQHFTLRRYEPAAETWQVLGGLWDRFQMRTLNEVRKPITFINPCSRIRHIPLYSGSTGAENLEDVDNSKKQFVPFTVLRTPQPRYTETAQRPNIPGYKGNVHFSAIHPLNQCPPTLPTTARVHRYILNNGSQSPNKHLGPLSRMVTTVPSCNPFTKGEEE
ncbi:spermatogenesis-associated protein 48 isoform X1 [Huso huso]|uniref:Spermatogenesis-associated protein 48 isoform X1 n=1 Tax=Huso huso TaxID=61971 RepID=A0ABR1A3R3_HUSHU